MMNLIVAVILENFSSLGDMSTDLVSPMDISEFAERWGQCVSRRSRSEPSRDYLATRAT